METSGLAKTALFVALLMTAPSLSSAGTETAGDLFSDCQKAVAMNDAGNSAGGTSDVISAGFCYGYLSGFTNGYSYKEVEQPAQRYCEPNEVTSGQLARIFVNKLHMMPEVFHLPVSVVLPILLHNVFPCDQLAAEPQRSPAD